MVKKGPNGRKYRVHPFSLLPLPSLSHPPTHHHERRNPAHRHKVYKSPSISKAKRSCCKNHNCLRRVKDLHLAAIVRSMCVQRRDTQVQGRSWHDYKMSARGKRRQFASHAREPQAWREKRNRRDGSTSIADWSISASETCRWRRLLSRETSAGVQPGGRGRARSFQSADAGVMTLATM